MKSHMAETHTICHLLYMDDLKVYMGIQRQLNQLIKTVELFTTDIKMEFGLDKCQTLNIRCGKVELEGFETRQCDIIEPMNETDTYKYPGILKCKQIQHTKIKKQLTTALTSRLKKILKTHLNSKNPMKAIDKYITPPLIYSYGITSWSQTHLAKTRKNYKNYNEKSQHVP
jgi:hypothetical protein